MSDNEIPRRAQLFKFSVGERAIYDAMHVVEGMGAHPRLTDAVVLLQQARAAVADYVDTLPPHDATGSQEVGHG